MKKLLTYIILIIPVISFCQPTEEDENQFRLAIDWLENKLTYNYYDPVSQKWWLNSFYVNDEKDVIIKNIRTSSPNSVNVKEREFHQRSFNIKDINPNRITINEAKTNHGRIVKGKRLELHTFGNRKDIHHKINNRSGTDLPFFQFSFPNSISDSISVYANDVKAKMAEAIISITKIYASQNFEDNKQKILSILNGTFKSTEGKVIEAERKFEHVILLSISEDSENYFGFLPNEDLFHVTSISDDGVESKRYQFGKGSKLILQNMDDPEDQIEFETSYSFKMYGNLYYRE
jgi:hypothetical protein